MFLAQVTVEKRPGGVAAPAFFFPMEVVFERAVTNLLKQRLPDVRAQYGRTYRQRGGEPPRAVSYAADIVVGSPPGIVIDTKYSNGEVRNQYGGWSLRNPNIYQAIFYGLSLGCPSVLVYPKVDRHLDLSFDIEGRTLTVLTVDLGGGMAGLEALVDRLTGIVQATSVASGKSRS